MGRFATTIFRATQHYNIVATLFRMVATLFQHCYAVWRSNLSCRCKSSQVTSCLASKNRVLDSLFFMKENLWPWHRRASYPTPCVSASDTSGLFTWSGGPRSSGVGFFCFHALEDTKQKKPTPLDRGPPLYVNRVLDRANEYVGC